MTKTYSQKFPLSTLLRDRIEKKASSERHFLSSMQNIHCRKRKVREEKLGRRKQQGNEEVACWPLIPSIEKEEVKEKKERMTWCAISGNALVLPVHSLARLFASEKKGQRKPEALELEVDFFYVPIRVACLREDWGRDWEIEREGYRKDALHAQWPPKPSKTFF